MTDAAFTFESLLTRKAGFDLPASPLQRAIARAADGRPVEDALDDAAIERHFGCDRSKIGLSKPVLVAIVAGVRGGKSLLAACAAVKATLTVDLRATKTHEIVRFAIVGPTVDNADATFRLLVGHVRASPVLNAMVVGDPTSDTIVLRRLDGRIVEIVVVAAHRGAVTLRSRWLAGFVLDEVALFGTESTGAVVNAEELLRAGETRLVPGAQGWLISSPFGPAGLLWELYRDHFGKPGEVLVVHAPTRAMNPSFPAEKVEAIRARSPDVAAREYDATWLDADTAFLNGAAIDAAVRPVPIEEPRKAGVTYVAAWDAATRGNSWTLVIARGEKREDGQVRVVVAVARQWTGSRSTPLDPGAVIGEIAGILNGYGVRRVLCDQWGADALRSIARQHSLEIRDIHSTTEQTFERFDGVRTLLATGRLELPPVPELLQDLRLIRKKALSNGVRIDLPKTADGRHCDYAPALALACSVAPSAEQMAVSAKNAVSVGVSPMFGAPHQSIFDSSGAGSAAIESAMRRYGFQNNR
jgi:hypothetical protein